MFKTTFEIMTTNPKDIRTYFQSQFVLSEDDLRFMMLNPKFADEKKQVLENLLLSKDKEEIYLCVKR